MPIDALSIFYRVIGLKAFENLRISLSSTDSESEIWRKFSICKEVIISKRKDIPKVIEKGSYHPPLSPTDTGHLRRLYRNSAPNMICAR